jgi:hypothetical protein
MLNAETRAMNDPRELPHLLRLLDDPDRLTRDTLSQAFAGYGADLDPLLDQLPQPPTPAQRRVIRSLLDDFADAWLRAHWPAWSEPVADKDRLESGLEMLSFYLGGLRRPRGELTRRLDAVAGAYLAAHPEPVIFSLAAHLGGEMGLTGAVRHYHDPLHSDLVHVLDSGQGLPLTLSCIFILVADRVHLPVEGCGNPGHFLAVARHHEDLFLVDGFHGWQFFKANEFLRADDPVAGPVLRSLERGCPASAILRRALHNLRRSFEIAEEPGRARLMEELRATLPA